MSLWCGAHKRGQGKSETLLEKMTQDDGYTRASRESGQAALLAESFSCFVKWFLSHYKYFSCIMCLDTTKKNYVLLQGSSLSLWLFLFCRICLISEPGTRLPFLFFSPVMACKHQVGLLLLIFSIVCPCWGQFNGVQLFVLYIGAFSIIVSTQIVDIQHWTRYFQLIWG